MTATPVYTALGLVEDAVIAALGALSPMDSAYWSLAPAGTAQALISGTLSRCYVAQSQDGGGNQDKRLGSAGWAGLVVVRVLSLTQATARAGYALLPAAMASLTVPAGYRIHSAFDRPIAIPQTDGLYTTAGQWRVTIRRSA